MQKISANSVIKEMLAKKSTAKALHAQRFFKTGKGQYGEGDLFLGITVPEVRVIAKKYQEISLAENCKLVQSKWHEIRLLGLIIWVMQYQNADRKNQKLIYQKFMQHKSWINNWDLVDVSTPHVSGHFIFHAEDSKLLYRLAKSSHLWDRRIAVVSTFYHIRQNQFSEILKLSEMLLNDEEDLMHKACGWMLREVGKRNKSVLVQFLQKNAGKMPRTMLRYAIEKFPQAEKQKFMNWSK